MNTTLARNFQPPAQPEPQTITLHSARVVQSGPHYSLLELDLPGMPQVRLDHTRVAGSADVRVGTRMFVGPLVPASAGLQAGYGFVESPAPVSPAAAGSPNPGYRRTGTIHRVHQSGAFGEIITADTRESVFIHHSELCDQSLKKGLQVSFETEIGPKGLRAVNAWAE